MSLHGQVALVTGSSRGIGAEIARAMVGAGAAVVITYNDSRVAAEQLYRDLRQRYHPDAVGLVKLDVTDRDSIHEALDYTLLAFDKLDILVNNAGINRTADIDRQTEVEMWEVIDTDLLGPWRMSQMAIGAYGESSALVDGGCIINIGSISGQNGGPRTTSYCIAKRGLEGLTENFAKNLGHRGIRVVTIHPGVIESDMTDKTMPATMKEERLSQIVLGRLGTAQDIAQMCVAVAENTWITGTHISVNGGEANLFA